MIGLDTNVLLRALVSETLWPDQDLGQIEAARDLIRDRGETFFVNHVVLVEAVWVLTQALKQPKEVVLGILDVMLSATNVSIDQREAVAAAVMAYRRGKPGFADHLIGHVNRMAGCKTTVSFDKDARSSPAFRRLAPKSPRRGARDAH